MELIAHREIKFSSLIPKIAPTYKGFTFQDLPFPLDSKFELAQGKTNFTLTLGDIYYKDDGSFNKLTKTEKGYIAYRILSNFVKYKLLAHKAK